ncbi:hypothetical protein [Pseudarthrobacter sp. NamB4]|uniref:hypothetical protein n=1 Tax=Pseudarthrobacter sp. NamB4 TaxID=2576837 RepID=UPI0010FE7DA1|nr:hypothetical protein [Pseudarthrobacter sp. NamB4]TLM72421.1 hypothetical protein FDW81_12900 [Pseudarthrobacter sp. NamB4]
MEITPTIPADVSATIDRRAARRMEKLTRFAKDPDSIGKVPAPLRKPFNLKSWRALAEDVRLQHLTKKVCEQLTAEELAKLQYRQKLNAARAAVREAARKRPSRPPVKALSLPEAKAPTLTVVKAPSPAAPRRRLVACVAGCGEFHPATSHKPVVVSCGGWLATGRRKARDLFSAQKEVSHEGTKYLIRALRREAEEARRLADFGAEAKKQERKPKARRRAICSNTR